MKTQANIRTHARTYTHTYRGHRGHWGHCSCRVDPPADPSSLLRRLSSQRLPEHGLHSLVSLFKISHSEVVFWKVSHGINNIWKLFKLIFLYFIYFSTYLYIFSSVIYLSIECFDLLAWYSLSYFFLHIFQTIIILKENVASLNFWTIGHEEEPVELILKAACIIVPEVQDDQFLWIIPYRRLNSKLDVSFTTITFLSYCSCFSQFALLFSLCCVRICSASYASCSMISCLEKSEHY